MRPYVFKASIATWTAAGLAGITWCAVAMAVITDSGGPVRDGRCDRCGGCDRVQTTCVIRTTEKEVTTVCWGYRCEQVCIPGPSIFCGTRCQRDDCRCWACWLWKPTCAEVVTRRVPVKREVRRKVPAVERKVEERCCQCRHDEEGRPERETPGSRCPPYRSPRQASLPREHVGDGSGVE